MSVKHAEELCSAIHELIEFVEKRGREFADEMEGDITNAPDPLTADEQRQLMSLCGRVNHLFKCCGIIWYRVPQALPVATYELPPLSIRVIDNPTLPSIIYSTKWRFLMGCALAEAEEKAKQGAQQVEGLRCRIGITEPNADSNGKHLISLDDETLDAVDADVALALRAIVQVGKHGWISSRELGRQLGLLKTDKLKRDLLSKLPKQVVDLVYGEPSKGYRIREKGWRN